MPDRPDQARESYASGPFVSIRAGGPFNGVVTITAVADGNGRVLVAAAWTRENKPRSASRIVVGEDPARALAQQWADPARHRDRAATGLTSDSAQAGQASSGARWSLVVGESACSMRRASLSIVSANWVTASSAPCSPHPAM